MNILLFLIVDDPLMTAVTIIFPHQLFKVNPAVKPGRKVILVEEELYFNQISFHKKKLVLHRASMMFYKDYLCDQKIIVDYVHAKDKLSDIRKLIPHFAENGVNQIHYTDVVDDWLGKRLEESCKACDIHIIKYPTPYFLNTLDDVEDFFSDKKTYFQTDFYIWQRKKRNILLDENEKPIGGKWTYDSANRAKFPKGELVPKTDLPKSNSYVSEAIAYVEVNFKNNCGNTEPPFFKRDGFFPVTYYEAEKWLDDFLKERFAKFGIYEDAVVKDQSILHHSVLSPLLNIGVLTPEQVIDKALDAAVEYDVPLNSLEGFIRQIVGWREYIRIVYEREGSYQRTKNYWNFKRKIPETFWTGTTGIHPLDVVIKRVLQNGWSHHIERLMVMGNFMLLCEFDPDEVYRWFMEMYVDAYDWVMVPNTYGMTQFADGGLMMTKPYISSSNYLLKMGNWDKGSWQNVWDGLFWRFMHLHRDFFSQNPRLGMLLKTFDKMPNEKRKAHLQSAENFLIQLDQG